LGDSYRPRWGIFIYSWDDNYMCNSFNIEHASFSLPLKKKKFSYQICYYQVVFYFSSSVLNLPVCQLSRCTHTHTHTHTQRQ
jgi:hypothetical protein